jgi:lipoprotein NlpD
MRWTPEYHVVKSGETLYSIAFQYGIDQRDLAAWNRLGSGALIFPGQKIRLSGSATAGQQAGTNKSSGGSRSTTGTTRVAKPAQPPADWQWPTNGPVVAGYGTSSKTQSGIQIGGRKGQDIRAAAGGEVVYAGGGLTGYGQLVIIKHNADYLSAYGHNEALLVTEGERVKLGQRIARMGTGPGQRPLLHFEIRRDGEPVNPTQYLPRK